MTIDVYTWPTPNGHKVHIMLEECGFDYAVHPIAIGEGEQFEEFFLKLNPNHRIPVIVDPDGPDGEPLPLFESGAILIYLAEKAGKFLPMDPRERLIALQWLMFQMGGVGPMFGQANHFLRYAPEEIPYAQNRYRSEVGRLLGVLDKRLAEAEYLGGGDYTIADMATWPWIRRPENQGQDRNDFPNVSRWFKAIAERPAVERAVEVLADRQRQGNITDEERKWMFGKEQYQKRA